MVESNGLNSSELGQGSVEGFCEEGNKLSGSIKGENFLTS